MQHRLSNVRDCGRTTAARQPAAYINDLFGNTTSNTPSADNSDDPLCAQNATPRDQICAHDDTDMRHVQSYHVGAMILPPYEESADTHERVQTRSHQYSYARVMPPRYTQTEQPIRSIICEHRYNVRGNTRSPQPPTFGRQAAETSSNTCNDENLSRGDRSPPPSYTENGNMVTQSEQPILSIIHEYRDSVSENTRPVRAQPPTYNSHRASEASTNNYYSRIGHVNRNDDVSPPPSYTEGDNMVSHMAPVPTRHTSGGYVRQRSPPPSYASVCDARS